jgi:UDP-N-acetylglucosamine 1-carboxyvinyltransferase
MRASFLITGPLLSRLGRAKVPLPGGCAIGSRPIDLHLKGFAHLGVEVIQSAGYVEAQAGLLRGGEIYLDFPSVGATENLMMLAASIPGETLLINAAKEPEVVDLARFLTLMGAEIQGVGSDVVLVKGKKNLQGVEYEIINDRIEAGTFCVAAAITRGEVEIEGVDLNHIFPIVTKLEETGARVRRTAEKSLLVTMQKRPRAVNIKTMPHPGFPTDMQAQFTALLCIAEGVSVVTETVFESRFAHVGELERMGANIQVEGRSVIVRGVESLYAAQVAASDLRAGAALVLAGLAAQGETEISGLFHIDRGYEAIEDKLNSLGAFIKRVKDVDRGNVDVE